MPLNTRFQNRLILTVLTITIALLSLYSPKASADYVLGSCTIIDPVIPPNGTSCPSDDLDSVTLLSSDFRFADFGNTQLTNVDFDSVNLSHAFLSGADITGSNFANTDLSHANFESMAGGWVIGSFSNATWNDTICDDGTNSNQYVEDGNGCFGTFSDDDGDGVRNADDAFPNNNAAHLDQDADGFPDDWNESCDSACQGSSGLFFDFFPEHVAASADSDKDGFPDNWNPGCLSACQTASGLALDTGELFVDATKTWVGQDGLSWTNAFPNVTDALAVAVPGQEIWIATGVYYPDEISGGDTGAPGDSFVLVNNVALIGGFSGSGLETSTNQVNPGAFPVIFSGDIQQNDNNKTNDVHTAFESGTNHAGTNSTSIVTANGVRSRLMGIIITGGGNAGTANGGGINCSNSLLALEQVEMFFNRSSTAGGAIYCSNGSMHALELRGVNIDNNHTDGWGGGVAIQGGKMEIEKSTFSQNRADTYGGGIAQVGTKSEVSNSTIAYNSSVYAGGVYVDGDGALEAPQDVDFAFVTLAFNGADGSGGSDHGGGLFLTSFADVVIDGSLIVGNTSVQVGSENAYRSSNSQLDSQFSSWGSSSDDGLYLLGTGATDFATMFVSGNSPSLFLPSGIASSLINATITYEGGLTPVITLPNTSPLINGIPEFDCKGSEFESDQRGVERPYPHDSVNLNCDFGAFEFNDHDLDGLWDNNDPDDDNDNMPDSWELANGLDPYLDDSGADPDSDTLTNLQEFNLLTDPQVANGSESEHELVITPKYHRYGFENATCQTLATPVLYTIHNFDDTTARNISTISFDDDLNSGAWQLVTGQDNCSGQTVNAGSSCTFEVVFCDSSAGNKSAILQVSNDDPETPTLTSALYNYEGDADEAQRRLPPVLTRIEIEDSGATPVTNGEIAGGETHTIEWDITGYHPDYESAIVAFNCNGISEPNCASFFNPHVYSSGLLTQTATAGSAWTYNGIVANTYTYTTSLNLPYNGAEDNKYIIRFYRKSQQDAEVGNGSLSLIIPGNIMPGASVNSGYYDTTGRRFKLQVLAP